jgi:hypothetical protein
MGTITQIIFAIGFMLIGALLTVASPQAGAQYATYMFASGVLCMAAAVLIAAAAVRPTTQPTK